MLSLSTFFSLVSNPLNPLNRISYVEPCVVFQEAFGFIERADVVKEIFFHYSEFKGDLEALQAGDDVEFTIKDRNVGFSTLAFPIP